MIFHLYDSLLRILKMWRVIIFLNLLEMLMPWSEVSHSLCDRHLTGKRVCAEGRLAGRRLSLSAGACPVWWALRPVLPPQVLWKAVLIFLLPVGRCSPWWVSKVGLKEAGQCNMKQFLPKVIGESLLTSWQCVWRTRRLCPLKKALGTLVACTHSLLFEKDAKFCKWTCDLSLYFPWNRSGKSMYVLNLSMGSSRHVEIF